MQIVAILTGLVLGVFAAVAWHMIIRHLDTQPLFIALGRSVRAMLSDDGRFLREYGILLARVGSFVSWNILALAAALAPFLLVLWLSWPHFRDYQVLLIAVYSIASMISIIWLHHRRRQSTPELDHGGLSIGDSQYFFLQLVESAPWLMRQGATFETRLFRRRLDNIEISRPIFITGLARSGTTMMLELIAQVPGVATHRYRDFPFLMTPYLWNRFVDIFGSHNNATERPHQDGIRITPESPEAFEEPIWHAHFPNVHRPGASHVLGDHDANEYFDDFFVDHLKKILLVRQGDRYASKGNYNVTRIEYIISLFPDARFIVPIRHPTSHVASLVRQHELFCEYSARDRRVPNYLAAAGHFEFGPQRVPISIGGSADETAVAWQAADEYKGYAIQWAAVYGHVLSLLEQSPALAERVLVVRYEDICDNSVVEMTKVLKHVELEKIGSALLDNLHHIKRSIRHKPIDGKAAETVWQTTKQVASKFGYSS